jgi:hypothetical protein
MFMRSAVLFSILVITFLFASCRETENPITDFGLDYQPLEIGRYWVYEVEETVVFGENDSQTSEFYWRDIIDYSFRNAENEEVFVVKREKSNDLNNWEVIGNYAMQYKRMALLRNFENLITVNLVFPPEVGLSWDAMAYAAAERDEFKVEFMGNATVGEQFFQRSLRVLQEEDDDEITFRDNRYEIFTKGVGLVEHYYEVFTYCSRNDCLGEMIIDSGRKTHQKILLYGKF